MAIPNPQPAERAKPDDRIPTRSDALLHRVKATGLQLRRAVADARDPVTAHRVGAADGFAHRLAENRTPLFARTSPEERRLELGKVQTLRRAASALDGVIIPAGEVFSFWRQVGRTTRRGGYVEGRQLLEGCLVPALGGGICQVTNALHEVALEAGMEIVERHPHSRVIPGSAAERDRDATVAWNYLDLRFRPREAVRLVVRLTATELIVQAWSASLPASDAFKVIPATPRKAIDLQAHSCDTCGVSECFRHSSTGPVAGSTAFILDECWPEFAGYVQRRAGRDDSLAIPLDGQRWRKPHYGWPTEPFADLRTATVPTLIRAYRSRRLGRYGARRLESQLQDARGLASTLSRALRPDATRVVVSQTLLPFLWEEGHLGGRDFEVLLTRTPLQPLHETLETLARRYPESRTAVEYRAPKDIDLAESEALAAASRVVTPHRRLAVQFPGRAEVLDWNPVKQATWIPGDAIAFPGPTAARKGAFEVRELARALDLEVVLYGSSLEGDGFWAGVRTRPGVPGKLDGIRAVVQPSYLEDRPRSQLSALAGGVPVIATFECGMPETPGLRLTPAGDVDALILAWRALDVPV